MTSAARWNTTMISRPLRNAIFISRLFRKGTCAPREGGQVRSLNGQESHPKAQEKTSEHTYEFAGHSPLAKKTPLKKLTMSLKAWSVASGS